MQQQLHWVKQNHNLFFPKEKAFVEAQLPTQFHEIFFDNMVGFGEKVTALAAEEIYNASFGAATNRHLLQFAISHGWISNADSSSEAFDVLKHVFPAAQHPLMNEVAGVIAQLLDHKDVCQENLLKTVYLVASNFRHEISLRRYLVSMAKHGKRRFIAVYI